MLARFGLMLTFAAAVCAAFTGTASAQTVAQKRVAVVIGNSSYKHAAKLANPINDAGAVAALFKDANFDVIESRQDLGINDMRRAIREFTDKARDADVAIVFYAGHGIEVDGTNYLLPVDAVLQRDTDVEDEAIPLDRILRVLEPAKRLRLVILDACRDNPFAKTMKRTLGTRSTGRGLAKVEPAASDTLVAFAAKAGSVATDGSGTNSPFTTALLKHLATPGLDLRLAFGRVRDEVIKSTNNQQEPFVYGSLGGTTVALVAPPESKRAEPPVAAAPAVDIRRDYEMAERIGTKEAWDSFLSTYSTGFYVELAKAARAKVVAADLARLKEIEQLRLKAADLAKRQELEQAKAKASEEARLKAEAKLKAEEQARLKAEEQARLKAEEQARLKAEELARLKAAEQARPMPPTVVALAPAPSPNDPAMKPVTPALDASDIARLLQVHLKRIGCDPGSTDGGWGDGSRRALEQFNKHAGTTLDVKMASLDALEVIKGKTSRICPLVCGKGYQVKGDSCAEIACKAGFVRRADGECEPRSKTASRPPPRNAAESSPAASAKQAESSSGGAQVFCGRTGCTAVPKNCKVEYSTGGGVYGSGSGQLLACR
jgi:uncharacterized caspase-like protein